MFNIPARPPSPKWDVKALRMNVVCGWEKRCLAICIVMG